MKEARGAPLRSRCLQRSYERLASVGSAACVLALPFRACLSALKTNASQAINATTMTAILIRTSSNVPVPSAQRSIIESCAHTPQHDGRDIIRPDARKCKRVVGHSLTGLDPRGHIGAAPSRAQWCQPQRKMQSFASLFDSFAFGQTRVCSPERDA